MTIIIDGTTGVPVSPVTGTLAVGNGGTGGTTSTGTGAVVLATSPALTTPQLGTPQSGVLTSCTGLPMATGLSDIAAQTVVQIPNADATNFGSASKGWNLYGKTLFLGAYKFQGGVFQIYNQAGTLKSAFSSEGAGNALGNFWGQISGATNSVTVIPTGTDSSTAMAGGGKIGSAATNSYIFNTNAQVPANTPPPMVAVGYNDTGTAIIAIINLGSRNVNGVTQFRWELNCYVASSGAAFALTTANIGSGKFINFQIQGYLV